MSHTPQSDSLSSPDEVARRLLRAVTEIADTHATLAERQVPLLIDAW